MKSWLILIVAAAGCGQATGEPKVDPEPPVVVVNGVKFQPKARIEFLGVEWSRPVVTDAYEWAYTSEDFPNVRVIEEWNPDRELRSRWTEARRDEGDDWMAHGVRVHYMPLGGKPSLSVWHECMGESVCALGSTLPLGEDFGPESCESCNCAE